MFYSKSTNGFYTSDIHGEAIPVDAVEITNAEHADLLAGQSQGKRIGADVNGVPILISPSEPTFSDLKAAKNAEINAARLTANRSTFAHGGKSFACDELSRSDIDGANGMIANLGAMPSGWPGGWKAVDNSYHPIADVAAWKAFYASMFAAGNGNFAHAQALKDALAAATTPEQVAAIAW